MKTPKEEGEISMGELKRIFSDFNYQSPETQKYVGGCFVEIREQIKKNKEMMDKLINF